MRIFNYIAGETALYLENRHAPFNVAIWYESGRHGSRNFETLGAACAFIGKSSKKNPAACYSLYIQCGRVVKDGGESGVKIAGIYDIMHAEPLK